MVLVYVPLYEMEFDVLIPINQKIGIIKNHIISVIIEMTNIDIKSQKNLNLYDKNTSICYENDIYVKNSGIKNGAKLLLM